MLTTSSTRRLAARIGRALLVVLFARSAAAQGNALANAARRHTAGADSVRVASCPECWVLGLPVIGAYAAVLLVAPPALLLSDRVAAGAAGAFTPDSTAPPGFWQRHVDLTLTVGPANPGRLGTPGARTWAHTESVDLLANGVYAEVRVESYHLPHEVRYASARVGYLVHRHRTLSAGATLGFRDAHGVRGESGPELALPMVIAGNKGWARFEPSYARTRRDTDWSYRFQGVWPIPGHRIFAGVEAEMKALPLPLRSGRGLATGIFGVLVGMRY